MNENFLTAQDVATITGTSLSRAYKIIRQLNAELQSQGFYTIAGKINRRFFEQKVLYQKGEK